MQNQKMNFILLQPFRKARIIELTDNIESFHKVLECRCIDIVRRSFGGITCDVICDDEGLLVQKPPVSVWLETNETDESLEVKPLEFLVGNILLCDCDEHGELIEHPRIDELITYFEICDFFRHDGLNWFPYNHNAPKDVYHD